MFATVQVCQAMRRQRSASPAQHREGTDASDPFTSIQERRNPCTAHIAKRSAARISDVRAQVLMLPRKGLVRRGTKH